MCVSVGVWECGSQALTLKRNFKRHTYSFTLKRSFEDEDEEAEDEVASSAAIQQRRYRCRVWPERERG